jgi:ABC-2 type transport system permease protein
MSETKLILGLARREATERARSKAFRVSTAILLLAAVAAVALPAVFDVGDDTATFQVGVVDPAPAGLDAALRTSSPDDVTVETTTFADRATAEQALTADDTDLDVVLADGPALLWPDAPDQQLSSILTGAITRLAIVDRAADLGVTPGQVGQLLAPVELPSTTVGQTPAEAGDTPGITDEERGPQALIATVGMILLFVSITFYGSYILMSVIEEKQNRVVEVLLAHVEPRDLLAAKVLGHGALGLAQFLTVAAIAAVGLAFTTSIEVPAGAYGAIAAMVLWFLLGYSFYSILYGALGSLASRTEDAQSAVGPLTILLMAAYFVSFASINSPDGPVALIGSFLPPTAPLMMPLRTAMTDVPVWQPAVAVVIELAAIVGMVRLGGRLYRGAVLRVGRKLSLREAWDATS